MNRIVSVWVVMEIANPFNLPQVYFDKKNIPDEIWKNYAGQIPKGEERKYVIRECSGRDSLDFCKEVTKEILGAIHTVNVSYDIEDGKIVGQTLEVI